MNPPGPLNCNAHTTQQTKKIIAIASVMFRSAFTPRNNGVSILKCPPFIWPHPMVPTPGISPAQFAKRMKINTVAKYQNVLFRPL